MVDAPVRIAAGNGGLEKMILSAPDGASAEVYLYGGQVTSWLPAGGEERLFLSKKAEFRPGTAIRGGVPVIFPQFSDLGPITKHGFARLSTWEPDGWETESDGSLSAHLVLRNSAATRQIWPHAFRLALTVLLSGPRLELRLSAKNTGDQPWSFTAALHTYLRVAQIETAALIGLRGSNYLDQANGRTREIEQEETIGFTGEVDRAYLNAPARLTLQEPGSSLTILQSGFLDTVVWNPGLDGANRLADLEPVGWQKYLCVEAALISKPETVAPGAVWHGSQTLVTT